MSVEYKVRSSNWSEISEKLENAFQNNSIFERSYNSKDNTWFEFRTKENIYEMPDIGILIKSDHLYISRYDLKDVWFLLENVKKVFEDSGSYEVEEL